MPRNCWGDTTLEEHHRIHNKIRNDLPELLSKLALNGQQEEALRLLTEWGTFQKKRYKIYNEARQLLGMEPIEIDVAFLEHLV